MIADSALQQAFAGRHRQFLAIFCTESYTYLIANYIVIKQ